MLKKVLVGHSTHVAVQMLRYGFVAVLAQVVDFGLLFALTSGLHIHYLLSAAVSFTSSLVINYALCSLWVFSKQRSRRAREVTIFLLVSASSLALTLGIVWLCTSLLGLYYLQSKLVAITLVFFWSFFGRRHLVFTSTPKDAVEKN
jgi:putative flippase GtrA